MLGVTWTCRVVESAPRGGRNLDREGQLVTVELARARFEGLDAVRMDRQAPLDRISNTASRGGQLQESFARLLDADDPVDTGLVAGCDHDVVGAGLHELRVDELAEQRQALHFKPGLQADFAIGVVVEVAGDHDSVADLEEARRLDARDQRLARAH